MKSNIKDLYQKSLDQKWNVIVDAYKKFATIALSLDCAFCIECESVCESCRIDKQICDDTGGAGLYRNYIDHFIGLRNTIDEIKNKIENKIKEKN